MKIHQRYRRLTLWNKIAFWGSLASIIGLLFALLPVAKSMWPSHEVLEGIEQLGKAYERKPQEVHAEDITDIKMRDLTNAVTRMCTIPSTEGKRWDAAITGDGKVAVKLFEIGGQATLSKSEWDGVQDVLPKDRPNDRDSSRKCVLKLVPMLIKGYSEEQARSDQSSSIATSTPQPPLDEKQQSKKETDNQNLSPCLSSNPSITAMVGSLRQIKEDEFDVNILYVNNSKEKFGITFAGYQASNSVRATDNTGSNYIFVQSTNMQNSVVTGKILLPLYPNQKASANFVFRMQKKIPANSNVTSKSYSISINHGLYNITDPNPEKSTYREPFSVNCENAKPN